MKLIKVLFTAAFFAFASAQIIEDSGVLTENDEFTGNRSCAQIIRHRGEVDYGIIRHNDDEFAVIFFWLNYDYLDEAPYGIGSPFRGENILFKIGDDVSEMVILNVDVDTLRDFSFLISVSFILREDSVSYLLNTQEEVRVRLNGDNNNFDFTFPPEVISSFRLGFLQTCFQNRSQQG